MSFFIADSTASAGVQMNGNPYSVIIMLVVFGCIFYFIIFLPQHKRAKEHKKLMDSISKDDEVLTTSGLMGRVTKISQTGYILIALNNTNEVTIKRDFIAAVLPRGTMKSINF